MSYLPEVYSSASVAPTSLVPSKPVGKSTGRKFSINDRETMMGINAKLEYETIVSLGKGLYSNFESIYNAPDGFLRREVKCEVPVKKERFKFSNTILNKIKFDNAENETVISQWGNGGKIAGAVGNKLWVANASSSAKFSKEFNIYLNDLRWNPKEESLALGYRDGGVKLWDVNKDTFTNAIPHIEEVGNYVASVEWESSTSLLIAYDQDQQTINRYDPRTDDIVQIYDDSAASGSPIIMNVSLQQALSGNYVAMSYNMPNTNAMSLVVIDHRMANLPVSAFQNPTSFCMAWGPSDKLVCASEAGEIDILDINGAHAGKPNHISKKGGKSIDDVEWHDDKLVTLERDIKGSQTVTCYDDTLKPICTSTMNTEDQSIMFSPGKTRTAHVKRDKVVITPGLSMEPVTSKLDIDFYRL